MLAARHHASYAADGRYSWYHWHCSRLGSPPTRFDAALPGFALIAARDFAPLALKLTSSGCRYHGQYQSGRAGLVGAISSIGRSIGWAALREPAAAVGIPPDAGRSRRWYWGTAVLDEHFIVYATRTARPGSYGRLFSQ